MHSRFILEFLAVFNLIFFRFSPYILVNAYSLLIVEVESIISSLVAAGDCKVQSRQDRVIKEILCLKIIFTKALG